MDCFYSVKSEFTREIVISRSRFICTLKPVSAAADAQEFIKSIRKRYPAATHYCYAYIANEGGTEQKFSDDGEPQGTAGQPMLEVLKKRATYKTAAVVTRYFGGIKLGAGGLVSAYTRSVAEALDEADVQKFVYGTKYTVTCGYEMYNVLLQILKNIVSSVLSTDFDNIVSIDIAVPKDGERAFPSVVNDALMGQATVTKGEDGYYIFD